MWIIVYSTINNKPWDAAGWRTSAEVQTLDKAHGIFDNIVALAETRKKHEWPYFGVITQVAIFRVCGVDTFKRKPRYYADYRDKRGWPIQGAGNLIDAMNSDGSVNRMPSGPEVER